MGRRKTGNTPSDQEILAQTNVPAEMAARYLHMSTPTIYYALQEGRAPFGFASQNPRTLTWTYHISPTLLVKYQRGEMAAVTSMAEIKALASICIDRTVETILAGKQREFAATGRSVPAI